jgi:hypothetical protein
MAVFATWVILAFVGLLSTANASSFNSPCPDPKPGLARGDPGVDAESGALYYRSQTYTMNIYSAFAQPAPGPASNYCVRYEAENTSGNDISAFDWPLADLRMDTLPAGPSNRQGLVKTLPAGKLPILDDTWVYAFKSAAAKMMAYQKPADHSSLYKRSAITSIRYNASNLIAYTPPQRVILKETGDLPPLSTAFYGSGIDLSANSSASWDSSKYFASMKVMVSKSSDVKRVKAPYMLALRESKGEPEILLGVLSEYFKGNGGYFSENDMEALAFANKKPGDYLYVVMQPVTFERANGRVCFLAAAYSPIPIPSELLACKLD